MAEEWLPFNGQIVNQDGWELYHAPLQENGLYGDPGGPVGQVYADSSGMQVKRRGGSAWVHGMWWRDTAEKLVPIGANGSSQPRIDRIVLRRNDTAKNVTTVVIPGTAAASPVAPALTQAAGGTWDVPLAQVYVDPGAVSIANGKVTDERTYVGLRLWRPSALSLLPTTGVSLWQRAVVPDGTEYRWNGSSWVQSSDVHNSWVPQAYSGSAPATYAGGGGPVAWNNGGALTSGDYVRDARWARVTGCVDPATNGPAFQSTATTYVDLPLSPVNVQGGQDLGGWTYLNDQGVPVAAGRVLWSGIATKGVMAAAGGGAGYAQLTTSNRWRMTFNLSYPVA